MAASLRNRSEYEAAHSLLEGAFAQDFPASEQVDLLVEKGWLLMREGRFTDAVGVLQEGLETSVDRRDAVTGHLHLQMTRAKTVLGDYKGALKHGLAGVLIFEQLDDLKSFAFAMRILGDAYRNADLLDDAAEALARGLSLAERTGNVEEQAGCLINLGMVHLARGALDDAIDCDQKAILAFESIGHPSGKAIAYGNLAEKLLLAGRYEDVIAHAAVALELAHAIGHQPTIADVTQTMAAVYRGQGDLRRAGEEAEQAAAIHIEMDALPAARDSLEFAADAFEEAGDTEKARAIRARAFSLTPV
jgi:tetratricopeptide (TPR) repeat protein